MKTSFKKNASKKYCRILSTVTAALMLAVSMPQAAIAAIPTDDVIASSTDFTITSTDSTLNLTEKAINASVDRVIVEFDATASSTDYTYLIMSRDTEKRNFAHLIFAPNGKVVVGKNGGTPYSFSTNPNITPQRGYNAASYAANTTYRMTMIYDKNGGNVEEGHNTTIDYYMNGKHLYTADTSFFGSTGEGKNDNSDGYLGKMFFGPQNVDGTTKNTGKTLKIENFTVRDADKYQNLEYDEPIVENNNVKIKFSETLACTNTASYTKGNDLADVKIKSIDGQEVVGTNASIKNETLTVSYPRNLMPGVTYYVILPKNFKSVDEKILADNAIAFTAPQVTSEGIDTTPVKTVAEFSNFTGSAYEVDFSDKEGQLGDKYLVNAEVTFNNSNSSVYFRCNDSKPTPSGLIFYSDADGNLSMSKSLLNWRTEGFMQDLDVKIELNKPVNIKLLVDKTKPKQVMVYINNKESRSLTLAWSSKPDDVNYLNGNPGAANFIKVSGVNSSKVKNNVTRFSIGNTTVNLPESITLADSASKNYGIYTDGIPTDINSISINYANAFSDGTDVANVKLNKKSENGELTAVDGYATALSTDKKSIVISKADGVLENGTYVISVSGVTGSDSFNSEFVVKGKRGLVIESFSVAKDGNNYYPSFTAINDSVSEKSLTVFICEYTKNAVPQLVNVKIKPITLTDGERATIDNETQKELILTTTRTDTMIKAFVWSVLGENKPLVNAQNYTAPVTE